MHFQTLQRQAGSHCTLATTSATTSATINPPSNRTRSGGKLCIWQQKLQRQQQQISPEQAGSPASGREFAMSTATNLTKAGGKPGIWQQKLQRQQKQISSKQARSPASDKNMSNKKSRQRARQERPKTAFEHNMSKTERILNMLVKNA